MNEFAGQVFSLPVDDLCLRWIVTLLHFLWQGTLVGVVVMLLVNPIRNSSASVRYAMFSVALLSLPLCVGTTFALLDVSQSVQATSTSKAVDASAAVLDPERKTNLRSNSRAFDSVMPATTSMNSSETLPNEPSAGTSIAMLPSAQASAEPLLPTTLDRFVPWLSVAYLCGVAWFLIRLGIATWGGHRLRSNSRPVADPALLESVQKQAKRIGLRLVPVVMICQRVAVPTVVGILRPMILLPTSIVTGMPANELSAVLSHELAHIRRYDLWMNLFQRLIESLLFFHPVVWFISRRLSAERELCCDDLVVRTGHNPMHYAGALLRMAELCVSMDKPQLATLAAGGHSQDELQQRIERLMDGQHRSRLAFSRTSIVITLALLITVATTPMMLRVLAQTSQSINAPSIVDDNTMYLATRNELFAISDSPAPAKQAEQEPNEPSKPLSESPIDDVDNSNDTAALNANVDDQPEIRHPYCIVKTKDLPERKLVDAIAQFNRMARESPTGVRQRPITEQETRDAIKAFAKQPHVADSVRKQLDEILATGILPTNVYFRRFTRFDDEQQMRGVWWVRLCVEGDDPPMSSVPVRETDIYSRPYTQLERRQNAEPGVTLLNRFSSYFEDLPNILLLADFADDKEARLIDRARASIAAKDLAAFESLFNWKGVNDSIREFVKAEFQTLTESTLHDITITPRNFRGQMFHWSAYQFYQPNLPVIGYLDIEYSLAENQEMGKKKLSLEMGEDGDDFRLVNYVASGERNLPKRIVEGLSIRGHNEQLADGTFLVTSLTTNPGTLLSAHLANEEIWQRDYNETRKRRKLNSADDTNANLIRTHQLKLVDGETGTPLQGIECKCGILQSGSTPRHQSCVTDEDGLVKIELAEGETSWIADVPSGWFSPGVIPRTVVAVPVSEKQPPRIKEVKDAEPQVVKLWRGTEVSGRLLWPDKSPAAGVNLIAGVYINHQSWKKRLGMDLRFYSFDHGDWPNSRRTIVTDASGKFRFTVPPAESRSWLRIGTTSLGFSPQAGSGVDEAVTQRLAKCVPLEIQYGGNGRSNIQIIPDTTHDNVLRTGDLQLETGIIVRGRVVDAGGNALSNVHLTTTGPHGPHSGRKAISGEGGQFEFPAMAAGNLTVHPDARLRDDKGPLPGTVNSRDVQAVFVDQSFAIPETRSPHEITIRAVPHTDVVFEWIDRRADTTQPIAYYGAFRVRGYMPDEDGRPSRYWTSETERVERDGKQCLAVKIPTQLLKPELMLVADRRVTASYSDSAGVTSGPGIVQLGDIRAGTTRTIYGDEPRATGNSKED